MKITFCISSLSKGGAERVISILANGLIEENEIEIIVNTKLNTAYKFDNKIKILELDKKIHTNTLLKNMARVKLINEELKKEKPDIILTFLPMPSFRILYANRKLKIPIIVADRNDPKQEYKSFIYKVLMKWLYPKADGFVFQTNEQKEYFKKEIQKKSKVIFNPIKEEFLVEGNSNKERKNVIVSVGRLVEQKNQKILINAFSKIANKYPEYKLKIFGEGNLKRELQKQIDDLNMKDRIYLCGVCDNIKEELEKAKIFVLSSNYEGMPNALIEAMASGCAVISTDCPCGGPRELIENNKNGILVPVNNEQELSNKIEYLIRNEEKAKIIGENAKKVQEKLNPDNILQQWENYIIKILQKGRNMK